MATSERAEDWDLDAVANEVMPQGHGLQQAMDRPFDNMSHNRDGGALTAIMKHNAAAGERLHNQRRHLGGHPAHRAAVYLPQRPL